MKYKTKEAIIKGIRKSASDQNDKLDEFFIYNCPMTIAWDINELLDYFGDSMPKYFYKLLWNIMRDAAYQINAIETYYNDKYGE